MRGDFSTGYLTPREREILRHIALGHQTKGIAELLGVGEKCVEKHRDNLRRKLDCHCSADLCRSAIALGLIEITVTPLERVIDPRYRERWMLPQAAVPV